MPHVKQRYVFGGVVVARLQSDLQEDMSFRGERTEVRTFLSQQFQQLFCIFLSQQVFSSLDFEVLLHLTHQRCLMWRVIMNVSCECCPDFTRCFALCFVHHFPPQIEMDD